MDASGSVAVTRTSGPARVVPGVVLGLASLVVVADLVQAVALASGRVLVGAGGARPRLAPDGLLHLLTAGSGAGTLTLVDVGPGSRLLLVAPSLLHATVTVTAVALLLQIVGSITAGRPFTARTVRAWHRLAGVLIGGGLAQIAVDVAAGTHLDGLLDQHLGTDRLAAADQALQLGHDAAAVGAGAPVVVAGLVALALAVAFRAGARLEAETDGLV